MSIKIVRSFVASRRNLHSRYAAHPAPQVRTQMNGTLALAALDAMLKREGAILTASMTDEHTVHVAVKSPHAGRLAATLCTFDSPVTSDRESRDVVDLCRSGTFQFEVPVVAVAHVPTCTAPGDPIVLSALDPTLVLPAYADLRHVKKQRERRAALRAADPEGYRQAESKARRERREAKKRELMHR